MNLNAEFDEADTHPDFVMVEGAEVARVGPRSPCPAGRDCGYRAAVFRTGKGCEYRGFLCGGTAQAGPCRRGWRWWWWWRP